MLAVFGPRHLEGLLWLPLLIAVQIVMNLGLAYLLAVQVSQLPQMPTDLVGGDALFFKRLLSFLFGQHAFSLH